MNKANIVPAILYAVENNLDLKEKIIQAVPDLSENVLRVSSGYGRDSSGLVTAEFHDLIKKINSHLNELSKIEEKFSDKFQEYADKHRENVEKHRKSAKKKKEEINAEIEAQAQTEANKQTGKPSFFDQVKSVSAATVKFAKSGFTTTPQEELDNRLSLCKGCEWWDSQALNETGRCKKCGCSTWAKLRMATEKCPIGKWGPVIAQDPQTT